VDVSRLLRAIAKEKEKELTKTTLQYIKSVLSTVFIYAKNEGAFCGLVRDRHGINVAGAR
jgi:hypothetical protein